MGNHRWRGVEGREVHAGRQVLHPSGCRRTMPSSGVRAYRVDLSLVAARKDITEELVAAWSSTGRHHRESTRPQRVIQITDSHVMTSVVVS